MYIFSFAWLANIDRLGMQIAEYYGGTYDFGMSVNENRPDQYIGS